MTVRPLDPGDLEPAAELCERLRARDPAVEPFGQRIAVIAEGPRALLPLWRVAEGEDGALLGLSFAAVRELRPAAADPSARATVELYAAVDPRLRLQGLGRALCTPALEWLDAEERPAALRARVRDEAGGLAGARFLAALGFEQRSAQLSLSWSGRGAGSAPAPLDAPALAIEQPKPGDPRSLEAVRHLSSAAWVGAPDSFESRADEIAQLLADLGKLALVARVAGRAVGYLSGVWLPRASGRTLAIEEVAVLPEVRRAGIGRALVVAALGRGAASAVLSVDERNRAARALYRSLGFVQAARRTVWEKRGAAATS